MKVDWSFNAQTLFDQLPHDIQSKALNKLERLERNIEADAPLPKELKLIGRRPTGTVYSFRVLPDWRLAIRENDQGFTVIDVARHDQTESLRRQALQE